MKKALTNKDYSSKKFFKQSHVTVVASSTTRTLTYYPYRVLKSITTTQMSHITPAEIVGNLSGFDSYIRGAVGSGNLEIVEKKEKEIVSHMKSSFLNGKSNDASAEIFLQALYALDRSKPNRGFQSQLLFTWIHA